MHASRRHSAVSAFTASFLFLLVISPARGQLPENRKYGQEDKFRQLDELLPTPGDFRTASGAPGPRYWQQQADYVIDVELDDAQQRLKGSETITYHNNSPDPLHYLWVQVEANIFALDSVANKVSSPPDLSRVSFRGLRRILTQRKFDGSANITAVKDAFNADLPHVIVGTMMRVDLPEPLRTGERFTFSIDWNYKINDATLIRARTGYEYFEKDGNYIYELAHWFPRMAAYTDVHGWQHKQFLGRGEFTLEFGDYLVRITVPHDHIVAATGELQNASEVLSEEQRKRLEEARTAKKPVFVVTPEEALENQKQKAEETQTWIFHARRVRDFAFASSRKFIWDAQGHDVGGNRVMAMSYYPNEGEPLWSRYSTHAILHTLDVYSRFTFKYPYPVAISVNGPVYGMEYPMITFNGPRPREDGTYDKWVKYGLISVIIHEIGHNYFPMIVNSDERRWTWMDEGVNTFLQYLAEQEWEDEYPSGRGEPHRITGYMKSSRQVPIMTHSESILQFGSNAYAKPATALNILRETILGRDLFDFAFQQYARRWMFKRPTPADLFRTLEDATATDLDWFFRGWFYTTDHTDIAITGVRAFTPASLDPKVEKARQRKEREEEPETLSERRNKPLPKRVDKFPQLKDFYNTYDELDVTEKERQAYEKLLEGLSDEDRELLKQKLKFYVVDFENIGGLVMPIILELEYADGKREEVRIPAQIWQTNNRRTSKLIVSDREIVSFTLDPNLETADVDLSNNRYPPQITESRFKLFKRRRGGGDNPLRQHLEAQKKKEAEKKKAREEQEAKNEAEARAEQEAEASETEQEVKEAAGQENDKNGEGSESQKQAESEKSDEETSRTQEFDGEASEGEPGSSSDEENAAPRREFESSGVATS